MHLEERLAAGRLHEMQFQDFLGPQHLSKMYKWIDGIEYHNFIDEEEFSDFVDTSSSNDTAVFEALGLSKIEHNTYAVGVYNAQDYWFLTKLPHPKRMTPKRVLDFGAGHGRQANLWFSCRNEARNFIAVDAVPTPYLTQRLYYKALGLRVNDIMDVDNDAGFQLSEKPRTVNHLPSWRLDLIPDNSVDLIICVQVLKELSRIMLLYAVQQFARILKVEGALYIRDHIGFHNVNLVDQDKLLAALGLVNEWAPRYVDAKDIHGVPRIWRKPNLRALTSAYSPPTKSS